MGEGDERRGDGPGATKAPGQARDDDTKPDLPTEAPSAWAEKRGKYKKRITLELSGPMLSLPGERPNLSETPPSAVFSVPEEFRAKKIPTQPDLPAVPLPTLRTTDGWSRTEPGQIRSRNRSSTPPPAPIFDTEDSNDALALVGGTRRDGDPSEVDFEREMVERYELGDFSGALRAAEIVLGSQPEHARAQDLSARCRDKLAGLYLARLGGGARLIERAVAPSDVRWLGIDHRAGFMLSQIERGTSVEELVDVSGMPRHDALKLLVELVGAGAVRLK